MREISHNFFHDRMTMIPEFATRSFLDEIRFYVERGKPCIRAAKLAAEHDPTIQGIWLETAGNRLFAQREHDESGLPKIAGWEVVSLTGSSRPDPAWCALVLTRKSASLPETIQGLTGWNDRFYPPSPLASLLASGILGAGLGYGGATLASGLLPGNWDKKKFRRMGLLLGGMAGAAPGALETFKSLLIGQPVTDASHTIRKNTSPKTGALHDSDLPRTPRYSTGPVIDSDALLHTIWRSPMVSGQLTHKERSLMTGVLSGAKQIADSPYLTPADMARLTAGMGVGYASGLVAGKALGTLTGMPPDTQKTLANTGMYAGIVKSILPMVFGWN